MFSYHLSKLYPLILVNSILVLFWIIIILHYSTDLSFISMTGWLHHAGLMRTYLRNWAQRCQTLLMLWQLCKRTSSALRRASEETSLLHFLHLPGVETSRASSSSTLVSLMCLTDLWTRMIGCVRSQGCSRLLMFRNRSGSSALLTFSREMQLSGGRTT